MLWLQQRFLFFPEHIADDEVLSFSAPHQERWFTSPTGHRLHAVHVGAREGSGPRRGTIVYFHGNAGSLRSWGEVGPALSVFGYDVVVVDYAGFGKSRGSPLQFAERSLLTDAQAVIDGVIRGDDDFAPVSARELVVFGRSLGSGIAVHVASTNECRSLILETPYASIVDVAQRWIPALAFVPFSSVMLPVQLPSEQWMRNVRCPVHVFHGDRDEVIPLASAERLRAVLPPGSTFTVVEGGMHNNLASYPSYRTALTRALLDEGSAS